MANRYRYLIVSLVMLVQVVVAFDRTSVSLLLADAAFLRDMDLEGSPERQGLIASAMLLPYALSNIFLGPAVDHWGPRRVLSLMTAGWTFAALFMGIAASYSSLLVGRLIRGVSEGPLYPISNRFVRYWFPPRERGIANALWSSGQRIGLALSLALLSAIIALFGWRYAYYLQALLIAGLLLPAVLLFAGDRPETTSRVTKLERDHIALGRQSEGERPAEWRRDLPDLVRNYRFWLAVIYHFGVLAVYSGLVTWLPKYLRDARGFDVTATVFFAAVPHILSTGSSLLFGHLSDRTGKRAVFCAVGLAGAGLAVCLAALVPGSFASALLIMFGFAMWGVGSPSYYAMMQRIVPGHIMATGIGIDNGLANLGSALAPLAVGFLIAATGSYLAGLLFLAALGVAGSVAASVLATQRY